MATIAVYVVYEAVLTRGILLKETERANENLSNLVRSVGVFRLLYTSDEYYSLLEQSIREASDQINCTYVTPQPPDHLIAPLGGFRVLVHPIGSVSLRRWRKTGEMMGLLPAKIDMWKVPGTITSYSSKRESKKELLYWQTLLAYHDAVEQRRKRGQKGKRGLLKETGQILEKHYNWSEGAPDSYTVRRYIDRAEKIWHISTY